MSSDKTGENEEDGAPLTDPKSTRIQQRFAPIQVRFMFSLKPEVILPDWWINNIVGKHSRNINEIKTELNI